MLSFWSDHQKVIAENKELHKVKEELLKEVKYLQEKREHHEGLANVLVAHKADVDALVISQLTEIEKLKQLLKIQEGYLQQQKDTWNELKGLLQKRNKEVDDVVALGFSCLPSSSTD